MTQAKGTTTVADQTGYPSLNTRTAENIAAAPLPTRGKLRQRQNLVIQSWRFARLNLKMMRIILHGHH